MKKKKKNLIIVLMVIVGLLLLFFMLYFVFKNKNIEIGKKYYDICIENYLGNRFEYELDTNGNYKIYLYNDGEEFYKVTNFNGILKNFSYDYQINYMTDINVIKEGDNYYIPVNSYNYFDYYVTYDIKSVSRKGNKLEFEIISFFCGEINSEESSCEKEDYVSKITKFTLIKDDGDYFIDDFIFPKYDFNFTE